MSKTPESSPRPSPPTAEDWERLAEAARLARNHAYAPYSEFSVGAALLAANGEVFAGCNVENLSFGLTLCAERNAIAAAVAAGAVRPHLSPRGLVVVADTRHPISPCGACRQVMAEFGDFPVILQTLDGKREETRVSQLLPRASTGILDRD